jgi:hypothetical protein
MPAKGIKVQAAVDAVDEAQSLCMRLNNADFHELIDWNGQQVAPALLIAYAESRLTTALASLEHARMQCFGLGR